MKRATSIRNEARQSQSSSRSGAASGRNASSLAPPAYGIDFVDRGITSAQVPQLPAGHYSPTTPGVVQSRPPELSHVWRDTIRRETASSMRSERREQQPASGSMAAVPLDFKPLQPIEHARSEVGRKRMSDGDRKSPRSPTTQASPSAQTISKPAIALGKRTRTMNLLPPPASTLPTVQQKPHPMTDAACQEQRELTALWIDTAARPDLCPPPVQMHGGGSVPVDGAHQLADQGLSGSASTLPHLDQIQHSFGHYDISGVEAHIGGPAAQACERMGAEAYATGNQVAFRSSPDLHTAAHEVVHVIQQSGGVQLADGVGRAGDSYEQHADRVADMVVRGESAEAELSRMAGEPSRSDARGSMVQHKLKLTGKKADYQRALDIMNRGMFGHTASVDAKGYVVLTKKKVKGKPNAQQKAMYDYLNKIISDAKDVTIAVGSKTKTLVGSYMNESIDMSDIEAMAGGGGSSPQGALIHELVEQYHKQVMGTKYGGEGSGAHGKGIEAENTVNGTVRGAQKIVSVSQNLDGTIDAVVEIPYTHPDGKVVTTRLTIKSNNIDKAEDKVTKKGRGK